LYVERINVKGFYLALYSIALRNLSLLPFEMFQI